MRRFILTILTFLLACGEKVHHASCNDVIEPSMEPVVYGAWNAVSESVSIIVTSSGEVTDWVTSPSDIEITLENIDFFNAASGTSITLESPSFSTYIGWPPE